jgi:hypothetical protein
MFIHEHISYYFKAKLNPSQHGFIKSKSTATNPVTYLDTTAPLVYSQRQVYSIYFDFSNAFDRLPHETLLLKLNDCGLCRLRKLVPWLLDQQNILCALLWSAFFVI